MKLLLCLMLLPVAILAQTADGGAAPDDAFNFLNLIVTAVTPVVLYLVKWGVPKIPKWLLPIAAPFVGLGLDWVLRMAGVETDGGLQAALLGAAGVWLREAQDQIRKAAGLTATPTTTKP